MNKPLTCKVTHSESNADISKNVCLDFILVSNTDENLEFTNRKRNGRSSLGSGFWGNPLVDLLAGGGVGDVLLRGGGQVELVDLVDELLGWERMCGGRFVRHTMKPAMPEHK